MPTSLGEMMQLSGINMPSFKIGGSYNWIIYALVGIVMAVFWAFLIYYIWDQKRWNKKVIIFKEVGGKVTKWGEDKGMFERIGVAGDYWLRTKKIKKIMPRPKLEISKNEFWFFEREDGEYINFSIQNLDQIQKEAKVRYIDEDMRLSRLGIQRNLKERYDKLSFWSKYQHLIMGILFMLIITICLVILFNQLNNLLKMIPTLMDSLRGIADQINNMVQTTCQNSGGKLIPVNATKI